MISHYDILYTFSPNSIYACAIFGAAIIQSKTYFLHSIIARAPYTTIKNGIKKYVYIYLWLRMRIESPLFRTPASEKLVFEQKYVHGFLETKTKIIYLYMRLYKGEVFFI